MVDTIRNATLTASLENGGTTVNGSITLNAQGEEAGGGRRSYDGMDANTLYEAWLPAANP